MLWPVLAHVERHCFCIKIIMDFLSVFDLRPKSSLKKNKKKKNLHNQALMERKWLKAAFGGSV